MNLDGRPSVLCVDDEPNLLAGLEHTLRRRFRVTTAPGGAEGLRLLDRPRAFDVIVSDYRMPGMDGAEFLRRSRETAPEAVRVLLTGHASLEGAIAAVNEGHVFRFLMKPCPPEVLVGAVEAAAAEGRAVAAERQGLKESIADLSGELKEASRLATVGRLASSFGHEINNMVTVLDGTIAGLRDTDERGVPIDPEDMAALAHVRRHLLSHGRNLMRLGKPAPAAGGSADLGRCVADAVSMLRDTGPLRRPEVVLELPREPVRVVLGETPLEQILLNLIKNASDAVRGVAGRPAQIRVAVAVDAASGMASCTVEDNGTGIPPESMERIFEPFHTTKEPGSGTGLGLFVVRHIVESSGGKVAATSQMGAGSSFTFSLPIDRGTDSA
jgi:C4-dicarboxylate-specific signal transduction histidine kinase